MTALIICALVSAVAGIFAGSGLGYIQGFRDGMAKAGSIWREAINAGAEFVLGEPAGDAGHDEEPK